MIFTFIFIYIFIYIIIFLNLLLISFLFLPNQLLTHYSISSYLIILQKYTNIKNLFFFCIFSLTGLPPMGLFFVKFNIFLFILYQTHFILICLLFMVFLLNMLYYIQLFNIKNYKKTIYNTLTPSFITTYRNTQSTSGYKSTFLHYLLIIFILSVLGLVSLNIFFYTDIFYILNL